MLRKELYAQKIIFKKKLFKLKNIKHVVSERKCLNCVSERQLIRNEKSKKKQTCFVYKGTQT